MMGFPLILTTILILLVATTTPTTAFSAGRGFGSPSNAFVSFNRFRAACPADTNAIRQFDPSLIQENTNNKEGDSINDDVWVAVYRSANNLPSVFVRDAFFDAMRASTTTVQDGDSETLVSSSSSSQSNGVISNNSKSNNDNDNKPVAVARLGKDENSDVYILDSMRCVLKKENTDDDCDGGSEHAEAIGVCIDELVLSYLQRYLENKDRSGGGGENQMTFDGGIHFRGTLISGKLLDSRGFREVSELSSDMHSHESDFDGALNRYAERSTSKEVAKNPGARDRALKIVSCLGRVDREEDQRRAKSKQRGGGWGERGEAKDDGDNEEEEESDFDPWASVKRYL